MKDHLWEVETDTAVISGYAVDQMEGLDYRSPAISMVCCSHSRSGVFLLALSLITFPTAPSETIAFPFSLFSHFLLVFLVVF